MPDSLQGTLDLLILQALTLEPNHGLGVARRVEQLTQGAFQVNPGSLFPALHRLEERDDLGVLAEFVVGEREIAENRGIVGLALQGEFVLLDGVGEFAMLGEGGADVGVDLGELGALLEDFAVEADGLFGVAGALGFDGAVEELGDGLRGGGD